MVYFVFLLSLLFCDYSYSQSDVIDLSPKIGSITIIRGGNVFLYSAGEKKTVSEKDIPYQFRSGDEVQTSTDSHCQVILDSGSNIYVGPETLTSIDRKGGQLESIFLKYGLVMFRGLNPVDFRVSDVYIKTISGDFISRYKKTNFELTFLNLGQEAYIKQTNDLITLKLPTGKYIKAISFKDQKYIGMIIPGSISGLYEKFKVQFKPTGAFALDDYSPVQAKESKEDTQIKAVNVDQIRRATGL